MSDSVHVQEDLSSRILRGIRLHVRKRSWLIRWARIIRAAIMLGPVRAPLLSLCLKFSKSTPQQLEAYPKFTQIDLDQLVAEIEDAGAAKIGYLPTEYVSEILRYCEQHQQASYWNPHLSCDAIDRISRNATLVAIARKYLGAEPRLWVTQLRWTFSCAGGRNKNDRLRHKDSTEYNLHDFHYDIHDFKSLTIFIYLTDVSMDSGPHFFIRGTHKTKTLREIKNLWISDDVAAQSYGDKIQPVLGEKGTIFAEDTSCYHKASFCENAPRLIASFDYVIRNKSPAVPSTR